MAEIGARRNEAMAMLDDELETSLPLTRRAALALGGLFAALTGFDMMDVDAKGKGRKRRRRKNKKRKKKRGSFFLQAPEMNGDKEVPGPGDLTASGSGECTIKGNEVCCTFQFTSETDENVTLVHIHEGAEGVAGDPVVDFQGQLDNCVLADEGIAAKIKTKPGNFYANIHTTTFPNGAVRDQLQAKAG
jgi:hypothetical protein